MSITGRPSSPPRNHTVVRLLSLAVVLWLILRGATAACAAPVPLATIRSHLIEHEGYRLTPYRDAGMWSVGVGHCLTANGEHPKARYTRLEVERFLMQDVSWAIDSCRAGIDRFDDLPHSIQLIAIGVAFTTGRTGFVRFTSFRRALSYRAFDMAASELGHSRWYHQVSPHRANTYVRTLRSQP